MKKMRGNGVLEVLVVLEVVWEKTLEVLEVAFDMVLADLEILQSGLGAPGVLCGPSFPSDQGRK